VFDTMASMHPTRRHRPRRAVVLLVAALAVPGPAPAQTSRAAEIAGRQADKARQLATEQSPPGERFVTRVMSSPLLAGSGGLYPWFGSIYNGTGLAVGAGYLHRFARHSRVVVTGAGSINGSSMADIDVRLPSFGVTGRVQPWVNARWSRLKDVPYHGIGSDTRPEDRAVFDYRPREANAGLVARVTPWLTTTAGYGYLGITTRGDAAAFSGPLPALGDSTAFLVSRAGATLDWRPSPRYSTRGGFLQGEWARHDARDGAPYSFDQIDVGAAQLFPFFREQFGLAFRAAATTTRTGDGRDVPFILMPTIGGGNDVRALGNRRFHDRSRAFASAEYRWRPSRYIDMALFVDSGAVAPRLQDLTRDRFETGYGVGVRVHGPTFSVFRFDVARGSEGWRYVFAGGLPF
jgi:hypothetical protein